MNSPPIHIMTVPSSGLAFRFGHFIDHLFEVDWRLVERYGDSVLPDRGFAWAHRFAPHDGAVERARLLFAGDPQAHDDACAGREIRAGEDEQTRRARVARD